MSDVFRVDVQGDARVETDTRSQRVTNESVTITARKSVVSVVSDGPVAIDVQPVGSVDSDD